MKVVVYDVAAESGGAMVVQKEFYRSVMDSKREDIQWFFLTSQDVLEDNERISVIRCTYVKRSWLHRLWFEYYELKKILRELKPDLLISLQNMPVNGCRCPQYVYLHQSLQFCPKRFSLWNREERAMAVRQTLIGSLIRMQLPKAEHIFVQTEWMRKATSDWISCEDEHIHVVPVSLSCTPAISQKPYEGQFSRDFFYPARAESYKNHRVILDACRILLSKGERNFRIAFTVTPGESAYAKQLYAQASELPIDFVGTLTYEEVWEYYNRTILLFTSYLETCGLPLLEAKRAGARIIASDMPFSHEALNGYPNVMFFPYKDADRLAECMLEALNKPKYIPTEPEEASDESSLMAQMLHVFEETKT